MSKLAFEWYIHYVGRGGRRAISVQLAFVLISSAHGNFLVSGLSLIGERDRYLRRCISSLGTRVDYIVRGTLFIVGI